MAHSARQIDVRPLELTAAEYFEDTPYTWQWLVLGISWVCPDTAAQHPSIPLLVARLGEGHVVADSKHLLSLTALWHLVPSRLPLYAIASHKPANAQFWSSMAAFGVPAEAVVCSNNAHSHWERAPQRRAKLQFTQFMCTPLAVIVIIALKVNARNQNGNMLSVLALMITGLCNACLPTQFHIAFGRHVLMVSQGQVPALEVIQLLQAWNRLLAWQDQVVCLTSLQSHTIPVADLLWYVFRTADLHSPAEQRRVIKLCTQWAHQVRLALPGALQSAMPALALPREC